MKEVTITHDTLHTLDPKQVKAWYIGTNPIKAGEADGQKGLYEGTGFNSLVVALKNQPELSAVVVLALS